MHCHFWAVMPNQALLFHAQRIILRELCKMAEKKERSTTRKEHKEGTLNSRNIKQSMCSKIKPQKNYYPYIPQKAL